MKNNSVGIIGMGWVGSSIAISLLQNGIARNLLLNDVREGIAEGEAMDLNQGSSFLPSMKVQAASIAEMHECGVIIITAGRGGRPGETRLELLNENLKIASSISEELKGYTGLLVIVTNPVDILTYFYQKYTEIPPHRVIGTGTFLDSARLREMIGEKVGVEPKSIQADVIGEHGDSSVIVWSKAAVGGIALRNWKGWKVEFENELQSKLRKAAQEIIIRKGATNHAIGLVAAMLTKYLLHDDRRVIAVSTVLNGEYGLKNVALSLPSLISENGIDRVLSPNLSAKEQEELMYSAEVIRKAIEKVI